MRTCVYVSFQSLWSSFYCSKNRHREKKRTSGRKSDHDNDELVGRGRSNHFERCRIFAFGQAMGHGIVNLIAVHAGNAVAVL